MVYVIFGQSLYEYVRFEQSSDISYSLLINPSHTDESWEGRNTCLWIYIYIYIYIYINVTTTTLYAFITKVSYNFINESFIKNPVIFWFIQKPSLGSIEKV